MVAEWGKENEASYHEQLKESNSHLDIKFKKLQQLQNQLEDIKYDDSFIKNLSGFEIPKEVLTVLSLGPKFAITPRELPILDLASDVELIIKRLVPENEQRKARGEQNRKLNRIDKFLQRAAATARNSLKTIRKLWCRIVTKEAWLSFRSDRNTRKKCVHYYLTLIPSHL